MLVFWWERHLVFSERGLLCVDVGSAVPCHNVLYVRHRIGDAEPTFVSAGAEEFEDLIEAGSVRNRNGTEHNS
jgi:hypothetical protein